MPNLNDYQAFKNTEGGSSGGGKGSGFGCGGVVIAIVAFMFIFFVFDGASWEAIDTLLGLGLLAFLLARSLFS